MFHSLLLVLKFHHYVLTSKYARHIYDYRSFVCSASSVHLIVSAMSQVIAKFFVIAEACPRIRLFPSVISHSSPVKLSLHPEKSSRQPRWYLFFVACIDISVPPGATPPRPSCCQYVEAQFSLDDPHIAHHFFPCQVEQESFENPSEDR